MCARPYDDLQPTYQLSEKQHQYLFVLHKRPGNDIVIHLNLSPQSC